MLIVDPDKRPDIFQVSFAAFAIVNKPCPVKNLHKVPLPDQFLHLVPSSAITSSQSNVNPESKPTQTTVVST